jgi:arylsulfatase A-like enzyme
LLSATQPAHASLFTGLDPARHRVVRNASILEGDNLGPSERYDLEVRYADEQLGLLLEALRERASTGEPGSP